MRTMPMMRALLICTMFGLTAATGCGVQDDTDEALTDEGDPGSDSQELTNPVLDDEAGFEADLVAESSDGSMTWYKPKYRNRPIGPAAVEPGHGHIDRDDNDKGTRLFCKWKGYKKVAHWDEGYGGDDVKHGTQRFFAKHPGEPPKKHCQHCKRFIKKITCKKH